MEHQPGSVAEQAIASVDNLSRLATSGRPSTALAERREAGAAQHQRAPVTNNFLLVELH